ncbi:MAG: DNA mismatch repair endonuclease MutH [Gammaproteobacteria bacterium]|nr:DNA mismatch repair endonuclease MutH [Gammaproteobacteria bacterium]
MDRRVEPPADEATLLERASELAGQSLAAIAAQLATGVPTNSVHAKGWAGELIEMALGAEGTSEPEPDFPHLGIELKTLPILPNGRARESTHVCVVPLDNHLGLTWANSLVEKKLRRVLWVPLLSPRDGALGERIVCAPLLWSPDEMQYDALRSDFEELMEYVALGRVHELTAHHGQWLQIRPKAANARTTTMTSDQFGQRTATNPRGFYLRPSFTTGLLQQHFIMPNNR